MEENQLAPENLRIPVGELLAGEPGKSRDYQIRDTAIGLTDSASALVSGVVTVSRTAKDKVIARGRLEAEAKLPCARCLEETTLNLHLQLEQEYQVIPPQAEELLPIEEGQINLLEAIYREIWVNLPLKILCREDCRGICPECGVNLNKEEHKKECKQDESG